MARYTVDELATASGLPTSTLRLYRHRGLLDPPAKEGRRAFYDGRHLDQLERIARLKDRGYSLAAIREMVELYRGGGSLGAILGDDAGSVGDRTGAGGTDDLGLGLGLGLGSPIADGVDAGRPLSAIDAEALLRSLFPDGQVEPAVLNRAIELGLLRNGEHGLELCRRQDLEYGLTLAELGVPLATVLDEYEHLQTTTDELAGRFADVFEVDVLPDSDQPAADLQRLIAIVRQVLEAALDRSLRAETDRRLALGPTDGPTGGPGDG